MSQKSVTVPIYVCHGWSTRPSTEEKWQPLLKDLQSAGYEVNYLKLPGLFSEIESPWHFDDYLDWLTKVLAPEEQVILMGHSFGGRMVAKYAALNSNKVEKLILIDSAGIIDKRWWKILKVKAFALLAKIGQVLVPEKFQQMARKVLYKLAREQDYHQASPVLKKTLANVIGVEILSDLPKIQSPTLIIWGENDKMTPTRFAPVFAEYIPDSQLKIIKGGRHSPQYTHPEEVGKIIKKFLQQ